MLGPWRPKDHLSRGLCSTYSVDKWTTREKTLDIVNIPQNPENKPRGLHFSKALFEGLVFGGAYLWREICVSKSIGLALRLEGNLPFLLCFTFYFEGNFQVQTPGGLIFGGAIQQRVFALRVWGAYIWRGLYMEGLIFGILRYRTCSLCLRVALPRRGRSFFCRRLLHTKISQPVYQKCGPSPHFTPHFT